MLLFYLMGSGSIVLQKWQMSRLFAVQSAFARNLLWAVCFALTTLSYSEPAAAQGTAPAPSNQSQPAKQPVQNQENLPEIGKSAEGKKEAAAEAAAKAAARHFDRVLIIVLENVDYEVAAQDKNLAALAEHGASFTNFHALFHPSYPNYLAMIAGTDFGVRHRRGRYLADMQVNFPNDALHKTIADRLIAADLDFKQYAEELPEGTCRS
jgi:hypothetical protein